MHGSGPLVIGQAAFQCCWAIGFRIVVHVLVYFEPAAREQFKTHVTELMV